MTGKGNDIPAPLPYPTPSGGSFPWGGSRGVEIVLFHIPGPLVTMVVRSTAPPLRGQMIFADALVGVVRYIGVAPAGVVLCRLRGGEI